MKSWFGSWRTAGPTRWARWADPRALLLGTLLLCCAAPLAGVPPGASAGDDLEEARRLLRDGANDPALLRRVAESGGLFRERAKLLAASLALARGDREGVDAHLAGLPSAPLGVVGLPAYLRAAATRRVDALLAFAAGASDATLARAALFQASKEARGNAERTAVRDALAALPADPAPRAAIARTVALARVAPEHGEGERLYSSLLASFADPVGCAADLFEPADAAALTQAARRAPDAVKWERARALVPREADEAFRLAASLPRTAENRIALAELALAAGRAREARKALERPARLVFADPARALHVRALELLARLRDETRSPRRRHARRPIPLRGGPPPAHAARAIPEDDAEELEALLAEPLADADRRPLLLAALRLSLAAGEREEARHRAETILALDPTSTAGAEELFLDAFTTYRRGVTALDAAALREASRLWEEQAARYRDVAVRRRATYWAGKARAAAGEREQARALWAGLVSGTSADVYGRWAAAAMGVPLAASPGAHDNPGPTLSAEVPAAPSRELLACGLPGLAEDAAEREGTLDPDFAAQLASERGDHRRAAALLKARYPALGTPEEGAVPLAARRAFYPLGAQRVLLAAAEESRIPPALLFALVRQESLFQPAVRSHAGAVGLLQVMPATGRQLQRLAHGKGRPDLSDPAVNARLGAAYLERLLASFEGDAAAALAAYNAGPGRVVRWRREAEALTSDEFLEAIPLSETRDYVRRILFFEGAYAALYGIPSGPLGRPDAAAPAPAPPL